MLKFLVLLFFAYQYRYYGFIDREKSSFCQATLSSQKAFGVLDDSINVFKLDYMVQAVGVDKE